ncbi:MAG TPA: hypothetical protein VM684_04640 [Gaiellales bacterium]|nr:hypothetical protein [Gaiellales bacterium]
MPISVQQRRQARIDRFSWRGALPERFGLGAGGARLAQATVLWGDAP